MTIDNMKNNINRIFTIGHSTYNIDEFVMLLQKYNIDTIVDIRSTPYSKFSSQFNRENLKNYLKRHNIFYIFMGDNLGARYEDSNLLFEDGKVDFKKVQKTQGFQDAINRLEEGIDKGYQLSLMCSEKEAFDCHRFGLVSEFLSKRFIEVYHIYPDDIVSQDEIEKRLLTKYNKVLPKADLFNPDITDEIRLAKAYEYRNIDIAYNAITKEGDDE